MVLKQLRSCWYLGHHVILISCLFSQTVSATAHMGRSSRPFTNSMLPSSLLVLFSRSVLFTPRCLIAKLIASALACRWLPAPLACPFAVGSSSTWSIDAFRFVLPGSLNVSEFKPDRRIRLGFCRRATESSDPVRCRRRGLRAATLAGTAASGENIAGPAALLFDCSKVAFGWTRIQEVDVTMYKRVLIFRLNYFRDSRAWNFLALHLTHTTPCTASGSKQQTCVRRIYAVFQAVIAVITRDSPSKVYECTISQHTGTVYAIRED